MIASYYCNQLMIDKLLMTIYIFIYFRLIMSNNKTVINTIEIVKKKLKKYTALNEHEKVNYYFS